MKCLDLDKQKSPLLHSFVRMNRLIILQFFRFEHRNLFFVASFT